MGTRSLRRGGRPEREEIAREVTGSGLAAVSLVSFVRINVADLAQQPRFQFILGKIGAALLELNFLERLDCRRRRAQEHRRPAG